MPVLFDNADDPHDIGICGVCGKVVPVSAALIAIHDCPGDGSTPVMSWDTSRYRPGGPHNAL
jgi:hypothetical protein